ncbi:DUF948 domain-containing protein [Bacillus sp. V59.32b]|uniref:DUF948 domain-containing protein n=1 Tax=Bacillus sp. V59.32b TaxID=1758642 RepID=UPI000E3C1EA8|nr:DUF948 domain-containing protein [Bacillus sp. V59.32b]RFU69657.1 DUF948 domain-containing protein [Bacillus sp. V59.32b]
MIIKVSVASASVAFVCLAAKLIQTLGETQRTIAEVRNSVTGLTEESQRLIHSASQVTDDIKDKIHSFDPLLESAQDVGEVIHSVTDTVKRSGIIPNNEAVSRENGATNHHREDAASSVSSKDQPARTSNFKTSEDAPVIRSTPNGGVKIRLN